MEMKMTTPTTDTAAPQNLNDALLRKFPELKDTLVVLEAVDVPFEKVPAGMHSMAVMGEVGDTKHIWDAKKPAEVDAARALFDTLTKKGYRAFHVTGKDGAQGEQMDKFDANAERVIFVPQMQGG
jgi:hypothetical protein